MPLKEYYDNQIDRCDFGVVADYLKNTKAPIHYVVHVQDRTQLAELAALLHEMPFGSPQMQNLLHDRIMDNSISLSSRNPMQMPSEKRLVDANAVPRHAETDVIYQPPFYIVHTPGLFQGFSLSVDPLQKLKMRFAQIEQESKPAEHTVRQKESMPKEAEKTQSPSMRNTPKLSI